MSISPSLHHHDSTLAVSGTHANGVGLPLTQLLVLTACLVSLGAAFRSLYLAVPVVMISAVIMALLMAAYELRQKRLEVMLFLYILAIPALAAYDRYLGDDYLNQTGYILRIGLTQMVLVMIVIFAVGSAVFQRRLLFKRVHTIDLAIMFFGLYVALSYYTQSGTNPVISQRFYGWIPYYALIYTLARTAVRTAAAALSTLKAIALSICIVILSRYLYQSPLAFLEGLYRIEVNYIYLSAVIYSEVLILGLSISYYLYRTAPRRRKFYLAMLVLLVSEVLFTQTRGAYIAAVAALGYYHVRTDRVRVKLTWKNITMVVLLVLGAAAIQIFLNLRELNQGQLASSTIMRGLIMAYYFGEMLKNMWFGWGFGSEGIKSLYIEGAHNTVLSLSYDLGIVGVIMMIGVLWLIFWNSNQLIVRAPQLRRMLVLIQSCVIGQIVFGLTTGNNLMYSIPMQILFFVLIVVSIIPSLQSCVNASGRIIRLPSSGGTPAQAGNHVRR